MDFWTSVRKPMSNVWSGALKLTRGLVEQGLEIAKDPITMREFAVRAIGKSDSRIGFHERRRATSHAPQRTCVVQNATKSD